MDYSSVGSSAHGISQARVLEWVAISSSRGLPDLEIRSAVSCIAGEFFTITPPDKPTRWDIFLKNNSEKTHSFLLWVMSKCWSWDSNTLATWCEELTHLKRLWCWERLRAGGEGDDRGWDDWTASLTQWTWVWVNSRSWWWTGRPGVLWFMGSQRVGHDWATDTFTFTFMTIVGRNNSKCFIKE